MKRSFLVTLFAALLVLFGASRAAKAAPQDSGLALPGSYAATHGAPLCDSRAASSYAADPRAPKVVEGKLAPPADGAHSRTIAGCVTDAFSCDGLASDRAPDDLQRRPPTAREVALVPNALSFPFHARPSLVFDRANQDGERDAFVRRDNPPPRPIPWRR
ncbi:MAG: hypothetical protein NVS3B20_23520 [Polyangiales bacterium]